MINFGCRLNIAEGEAIRVAAGCQDDLIVINSCAVTAEATRQARQAIRRAAKRRPNARIFITGCAAEVDPAMFAGMAEVVGNRVKGLSASYQPLVSRPLTALQALSMNLADGQVERRAGARLCSTPTAYLFLRSRVPIMPAPLSKCKTAAIIAAPFASSLMGAARAVQSRQAL